MAPPSDSSSTLMLSPKQTVTFAVNYQKSMLDQFWHTTSSPRSVKQNDEALVDLVHKSTGDDMDPTGGGINGTTPGTTRTAKSMPDGAENSAPPTPYPPSNDAEAPSNVSSKEKPDTMDDKDFSTDKDSDNNDDNKEKNVTFKSPNGERQRRSTREQKKKEVTLERARVRYDMQMVPSVKRNRGFLDRFPLWMAPPPTPEEKARAIQHRQQVIQKEQQELALKQQQEQQQQLLAVQQKQEAAKHHKLVEDDSAALQPREETSIIKTEFAADASSPFAEDTSIIWIPKKRSEWEDSVFEMTAVCTSASLRRHIATNGKSSSSKPFHAPLSKEYIRDRVDIDDPLNGYQIRHKHGGWLQGFILWTNFTTWTHYFKWDSAHAMSGIPTMNSSSTARVDTDGSMALQLEQQPRSGDPFEGGVVHQGVAEISLVGGLGCGEYLLRMALDEIRKRKTYKFVVLQATDSSKAWYERFGFIRVGCVCKFLRHHVLDPCKQNTRVDTPIMGYRHWTHPNESDSSLQKHGGPSYMMCLKLPEDDPNEPVETPFLDEMLKLQVDEKPTIEQIGGSATPYPKVSGRRGSFDSISSAASVDSKRRTSRGRRVSTSPSMTTSYNDIRQTPPVLPILRGANMGNSPTRNITTGTKRNAIRSNPSQSSKRRRLSAVQEYEQGKLGFDDSKKAKNRMSESALSGGHSFDSSHRPSSMKQKVKSYPRDRVHYYNKVVRPKNGSKSENYFVLHYDEPKGTIRIIPMEARGVLSGKRAGRPRFQAKMENFDRDVKTVHCSDYDIVDAFMVMKTPVVASEAWDILDA